MIIRDGTAKNAYVAIAACLPVSVLDWAQDQTLTSAVVYVPLVFAVFARELACDIPDIEGDTGTLAKLISSKRSFQLVVILYAGSLVQTFLFSNMVVQTMASLIGFVAFGLYIAFRNLIGCSEKALLAFTGTIAAAPAFLVIN